MRENNAVNAVISALGLARAGRITHPTYRRAITAAAASTSLDSWIFADLCRGLVGRESCATVELCRYFTGSVRRW